MNSLLCLVNVSFVLSVVVSYCDALLMLGLALVLMVVSLGCSKTDSAWMGDSVRCDIELLCTECLRP